MLCWFLIIIYTWAVIHCFQVLQSKKMLEKMQAIHLPLEVQQIKYYVGLAVPLVAAIFMSEGANWARVVYITWGIANYLLEAIVVPSTQELFPGVTIWAFACILLLLPRPRDYFLLPQFYT
jgi:hypothetical protein